MVYLTGSSKTSFEISFEMKLENDELAEKMQKKTKMNMGSVKLYLFSGKLNFTYLGSLRLRNRQG